jgi:hypothetical protein
MQATLGVTSLPETYYYAGSITSSEDLRIYLYSAKHYKRYISGDLLEHQAFIHPLPSPLPVGD